MWLAVIIITLIVLILLFLPVRGESFGVLPDSGAIYRLDEGFKGDTQYFPFLQNVEPGTLFQYMNVKANPASSAFVVILLPPTPNTRATTLYGASTDGGRRITLGDIQGTFYLDAVQAPGEQVNIVFSRALPNDTMVKAYARVRPAA